MLESDEAADLEADLRRRIEIYLDKGYGSCCLKGDAASIVQDSLLFLDAKRYRLFSWVVMPNHVHFLASPLEGQTLASILHSLKSYTSNEVNKLLGRRGQLWMGEYFDRFVRDEDHFRNVVRYIHNNPVKAGLCDKPSDWPWSSTAWNANNSRETPHQ
jgi:putative DNA methylase